MNLILNLISSLGKKIFILEVISIEVYFALIIKTWRFTKNLYFLNSMVF